MEMRTRKFGRGQQPGLEQPRPVAPSLGGSPMPRALPVPLRQAIFQRWRHGENAAASAAALGLSPRSARHLLARFEALGAEGIAPAYDHCGRRTAGPPEDLVEAACRLRR